MVTTEARPGLDNKEILPEWIINLRPTEKLIDFPENSHRPVFPLHIREDESFELENALRITVLKINSGTDIPDTKIESSVDIKIQPICQETIAFLAYTPIRVKDDIVNFGQRGKLKVDKLKSVKGKVKFMITLPSQIAEYWNPAA